MNIEMNDWEMKTKRLKTSCRREVKGSRAVLATLAAGMFGVAGSLSGAEPLLYAVNTEELKGRA